MLADESYPSALRRGGAGPDHIDFLREAREWIVEVYKRHNHGKLKDVDEKKGSVLVVGAGFIGVELATEIKEHFPNIKLTITDILTKCLGPLPDDASPAAGVARAVARILCDVLCVA